MAANLRVKNDEEFFKEHDWAHDYFADNEDAEGWRAFIIEEDYKEPKSDLTWRNIPGDLSDSEKQMLFYQLRGNVKISDEEFFNDLNYSYAWPLFEDSKKGEELRKTLLSGPKQDEEEIIPIEQDEEEVILADPTDPFGGSMGNWPPKKSKNQKHQQVVDQGQKTILHMILH